MLYTVDLVLDMIIMESSEFAAVIYKKNHKPLQHDKKVYFLNMEISQGRLSLSQIQHMGN